MPSAKFLFLFFLLPLLIFLNSCNRESKFQTIDGLIWNTSYHIVFQGTPTLSDSIINVLEDVDKSLNFFNDNSLLSKINNNDTAVNIDTHFLAVYSVSKKMNKLTNGMFDPTVSPLITAWGFAKGHRPTSDTLRVDSLLNLIGINRTTIQKDKIIKENSAITFNFSAIAKGYGCDQIAEMFRRNGITNFLIEIGGEIVVSGHNPSNKKWNVSIDSPILDSLSVRQKPQVIIEISDCGMATSGNYRNYHIEKGKSFGHTISPLSGRPITTDILSATIIAPTSMEADAIATSCMALGSQKALSLCESLGVQGYFILKNRVVTTPQFYKLTK